MPRKLLNKIKLKINLPKFSLELEGEQPRESLREINRLMSNLGLLYDEQEEYYEPYLESPLSPELAKRKDVTKLLTTYSQLYGHYYSARSTIPNKKIVELERGNVIQQLNTDDVHQGIKKLLFGLEKPKVKGVIVHIKGNNRREEVQRIIDALQKQFPLTTIKPIITKEPLPDTLVEAIFFGDFEHHHEEDY